MLENIRKEKLRSAKSAMPKFDWNTRAIKSRMMKFLTGRRLQDYRHAIDDLKGLGATGIWGIEWDDFAKAALYCHIAGEPNVANIEDMDD